MLINVTGCEPDEHWKRAALLCTITGFNENVFLNCFRSPAELMLASLMRYQLSWPHAASQASLLTRSDTKVSELPGQPSFTHMLETLYAEWGHQCMGKNFWIEMWKYRSRFGLSQGNYIALCDADSDAEKEAVLDICEHPIVIDAGDQRFREGLSYLMPPAPGTEFTEASVESAAKDIQTASKYLVNELTDLFAEYSLKLT